MSPPTSIDLAAIKQLSWSTTTTYTVSNIISYNLALGCSGSSLPLVYEGHPNFHALPTFGAVHGIAVMGLVHSAMSDFLPNFKGHNHVHGEHFLALKKAYPVPAGTGTVTLKTTAKVVDVVDRKTGVLVCVDILTVDAKSGDVVCENEWKGFVMRVPPAGSNSTPIPRGVRTAPIVIPSRAPDKVVHHQTTPEQGALYRAASNDLNPLHIDPATAKAAGFPSPILTGTCTMGIGVRQVIENWADADVGRFGSVRCRLSKPVFAAIGEKIRTDMWSEGEEVVYRMVVEGGREKVVMTGVVGLKGEGARL